jgi:hypothetical protein
VASNLCKKSGDGMISWNLSLAEHMDDLAMLLLNEDGTLGFALEVSRPWI